MLNEQPTNEAAEALQQVIDSLSDGHEAIVRPLGEPSDTADRKPLWQWQDELNAKHDARGTIRIVRPFSAADYQCQDEGLAALPDEQVIDLDGNSNYIVYCRAQGTSSERDSEIQRLNQRVTSLTLKVACSVHGLGDRNIARIREEIDRQAFDLQFERSERQCEVDALSQHFLKEIAEIRAAQSVDRLQIAQTQADIARLESDLDDLDVEQSFEIEFSRSPRHENLRAFACMLIGFAAGAIAMNIQIDWNNLKASQGIAHPIDVKLFEVCKSTQASYYSGLGFTYPANEQSAARDCLKRSQP